MFGNMDSYGYTFPNNTSMWIGEATTPKTQ